MPLADVIRGDIGALRALDESLMIDTCTVSTDGSPSWDENTGTYSPGTPVSVYAGKCQVVRPEVAPGEPVSGEAEWASAAVVIKVPVAASVDVPVGATVTLTACALDAALVGQTLKVVGIPQAQTFATSRRLRCEAVARG